MNRTLLCADKDEQRLAGSGRKWNYWDADLYKENVQKGFLTSIGNLGSISWYKGGSHSKWSAQVVGERLMYKKEKPDGSTEYTWREVASDHDALDALAQALAAFGSQGFVNAATANTMPIAIHRRMVMKKKRVKFV